jgi:thymidine kinase
MVICASLLYSGTHRYRLCDSTYALMKVADSIAVMDKAVCNGCGARPAPFSRPTDHVVGHAAKAVLERRGFDPQLAGGGGMYGSFCGILSHQELRRSRARAGPWYR